jgi:AraC-like DNA-binding protein
MKAVEINLMKDSNQSFIFYHERNPFSRWHYHLEFELVLINIGSGKRMVGDHIDQFEDGDLVFLGSNLPHEWLCDEHYFNKENGFQGEGIVVQFLENFLGDTFFNIPENEKLRKVLDDATQGCSIMGDTKISITKIMLKMIDSDPNERLYFLFKIFQILSITKEYQLLASPNFTSTFQAEKSNSMKKVIKYIMQNFQKKIQMKDVLEIINMSSTSFSVLFKKTYGMTFSEYILKVRIGYACSLLTDNNKSISQVSFDAGFDNLSNFNRLFKKAKSLTPKEYRNKAFESEKYDKFYEN